MVFTYIYPLNYSVLQGNRPYIESFSVKVWHFFKLFSNCSGWFQIVFSWDPFLSSISKDLETASGCDWSESHPLWIFSSTRLWRPGHRIFCSAPGTAGSWISIDSDIVSCNNWDVWDSQNTQKPFLAVKNYFKEMFRCYVWRCLCMWHGLWRYNYDFYIIVQSAWRMADVLVPTTTRHEHVDRRYRN